MAGQLRVLVVDDNALNLFVLSEYLSVLDCSVYAAKNASEAIKVFEINVLDVVITDLNMPEFDGYQLAELIRAHDRRIQIYATSASTDQGELLKTRVAGFVGYLVKPIRRSTIARLVDSVAGKKRNEALWNPLPEEYAQIFHQMISQDLAALELLERNQDINGLKHWLHRLSGGASVVGDMQLLALCCHLQDYLETTLVLTRQGKDLLMGLRSRLESFGSADTSP
jgi:two-component system capsular synthesis sensor histidine kinase RcsC